MSHEFARQHQIPLISCNSHLAVEALNGCPLCEGRVLYTTVDLHLQTGTLHTENTRFYITSPHNLVILGLPWLRQHNPLISWKEGRISQWDSSCQTEYLTDSSSILVQTVTLRDEPVLPPNLPSKYSNLAEAFSKYRAPELPPNRSSDCFIELLPGAAPPKGCIFPRSQLESNAMKNYINEEISKGFIRPSTSPASTGFFFIKKKDGGLRPCIDYRGFNDITVKFRYQLLLVPAASTLPS